MTTYSHFALETRLWGDLLILYLGGVGPKKPSKPELPGLLSPPLPTPGSRGQREGPQGPPFRFRHADPLKFQGPKGRPRRNPADKPWGKPVAENTRNAYHLHPKGNI